jgi:hypothetical protein
MPLTFEQLQQAQACGGTVFDPNRHVVLPTCDWITSVKSAAKMNGIRGHDRLFLYHHQLADTFVFAMWQVAPGETGGAPTMLELMVFAGPPGHSTYNGMKLGPAPDMERVLKRLAPASVHAAAYRKQQDEAEAAANKKVHEDAEARDKVARVIGKHNEAAARAIMGGMIPVASGDDHDDTYLRNIPMGRKHAALIDGNKKG